MVTVLPGKSSYRLQSCTKMMFFCPFFGLQSCHENVVGENDQRAIKVIGHQTLQGGHCQLTGRYCFEP